MGDGRYLVRVGQTSRPHNMEMVGAGVKPGVTGRENPRSNAISLA
jgi:hypothetical protein